MACQCQICRIVELYHQILQKSEKEVVRSPKKWPKNTVRVIRYNIGV